MDRNATPARRLSPPERDGCLVLGETAGNWQDGGEEDIAALLAAATDLSSTSDELAAAATTWVRRYHLVRERGHVLRPLTIGPGDTVLEIGAGCGAVTRYLGEVAGAVDALEPTPARARCAALRTRDLDSVAVLAGELEMLPREPAYDLIAAIGVLEYVGGADGMAERVTFLREAAARLRPGGTIAVAIENRLGVKYFAGAPEDHANLPFEGLEEYPHAGPYRTFARRELEALFAQAGLRTRILHAFPDYKLPRLLFADELLRSSAAPLAWRVPGFPSYDSPLPRGRLASEFELWRGAVRAGLGGELANSFLVLAAPAEAAAERWPAGQLAAFYTAGRRACYATETRVSAEAGDIWLRRRPLAPGSTAPAGAPVHRSEDAPFVAAQPLDEALERANEAELARLLTRWREHVEAEAPPPEGRNVDATPGNVLCVGDDLVDIDVEWRRPEMSASDVLDRAMVHLAPQLADRRPPEHWPEGCETIGDLAVHLAALAGIPGLADRLDDVLAREADLQAHVTGSAEPGTEAWTAEVAEQLALGRAALDRPLRLGALGEREPALRAAAEARLAIQDRSVSELAEAKQAFHEALVEASRERDELRGELAVTIEQRDSLERYRERSEAAMAELGARGDRAEAALEAVKASKTYRLASVPRRLIRRARRRRSTGS